MTESSSWRGLRSVHPQNTSWTIREEDSILRCLHTCPLKKTKRNKTGCYSLTQTRLQSSVAFSPQRFQKAALWWWVKCGYLWSRRGAWLVTSPVDASLLCSDTFCLLFAAVLDCLTSPGRIKWRIIFGSMGKNSSLDVINKAISEANNLYLFFFLGYAELNSLRKSTPRLIVPRSGSDGSLPSVIVKLAE